MCSRNKSGTCFRAIRSMNMTTKNKKKTQGADGSIAKRIENSWVLLIKDSLFEVDSFHIITLPHPAHGQSAKYCLDEVHKKIYEVVTFNEPYRSWFIGDTVKSEGSFQILSPVNPLFLVLPRLKEQCSSRAVPLEDLLSHKEFLKLKDYVTNLDLVADLKGSKDLNAYKYNEEKTLNWLEGRVRKLTRVLKEKNIHVTSGAVSATFVTSNVDKDSVEEEFYLKYAYGILSEYLQDEIAQSLKTRFDFKTELIERIGKKRKSEAESNESNKKIKCDPCEINDIEFNTGDLKKENKPIKPLSVKEKARLKAASGTKTISSFFSKK